MKQNIVSEAGLCEMLLRPRTKIDITTCDRTVTNGPVTFIAPRMIDEHLVHYNERGRTVARIAGREVTIPAGALLWVQPGAEHEVHLPADKACVAYLRFRFGVHRCPRLRRHYILCEQANWAGSLLAELRPARRRAGPLELLRQRILLAQLICEILQHGVAPPARTGGLQPYQQRQCLEFIHENLTRRYTIGELAGYCQLNPAYLTMQFRKSFVMTPQTYIKRARIQAAAGMLQETGRTISQIADELGYTDVYFFSRQFRQVMGQSPRPWRARFANKRR